MRTPRIFQPEPGTLPDRLGLRWRGRRPITAGGFVCGWGYVAVTGVLLILGLLLTEVALDGTVGGWDAAADRWFVAQRTATGTTIANWGSALGDTFTVIGLAALAIVILWVMRQAAAIVFLVAALLIEVTAFLTTTALIDRERPGVPQLDAAPPTSSFPSGHTAASIVLFVAIAVITTSIVRSLAVRILVWSLAVLVPLTVGLSRLYLGMHHPTDLAGSVIGAAGCLGVALLATRTGVAVAHERIEAREPPTHVASAPRDVGVTP